MADLTIASATTGFDASGIVNLKNKVHTEVIEQAKTELTSKLSNLEETLHSIWQGVAAEVFISNMRKDVDTIKTALDRAGALFNNELGQIQQRMIEIDQQLVKKK